MAVVGIYKRKLQGYYIMSEEKSQQIQQNHKDCSLGNYYIQGIDGNFYKILMGTEEYKKHG